MNPSESAFKDVAEELRSIRPRVLVGDATAIDNAIDQLISAHNFLEEDEFEDTGSDDSEPAPPFQFGDPPFHLQVFRLGDIQIVAISAEPLTDDEHEELSRRCSFPLDWKLDAGIQVESISYRNVPQKSIYDKEGMLVGSYADAFPLAGIPLAKLFKGGGA